MWTRVAFSTTLNWGERGGQIRLPSCGVLLYVPPTVAVPGFSTSSTTAAGVPHSANSSTKIASARADEGSSVLLRARLRSHRVMPAHYGDLSTNEQRLARRWHAKKYSARATASLVTLPHAGEQCTHSSRFFLLGVAFCVRTPVDSTALSELASLAALPRYPSSLRSPCTSPFRSQTLGPCVHLKARFDGPEPLRSPWKGRSCPFGFVSMNGCIGGRGSRGTRRVHYLRRAEPNLVPCRSGSAGEGLERSVFFILLGTCA